MKKEKYLFFSKRLLASIIVLFLMCGCSSEETEVEETETQITQVTSEIEENDSETEVFLEQEEELSLSVATYDDTIEDSTIGYVVSEGTLIFNSIEYRIIEVDGGDQSGERENNVAVDIGFGDRVYWGLTNEYGQLVYVLADEIILQDDDNEPVNSSGRYYNDEADAPGTEQDDLDQGHIIADSLGGVANAYNITPQNSTLNRSGDQAYMEKAIRDAEGCINFFATITYADTSTQIPSSYRYEYTLNGTVIIDEFENGNPEDYIVESETSEEDITSSNTDVSTSEENLLAVDTNGNGKVTIQEAKDAGYTMPITSEHWLYPYMNDADGDGMVGE